MGTEARIEAIEQNLLEQFRIIARSPIVVRDPSEDLLAYRSNFPLAMFNFIGDAHFTDVRRRTHAVLDEYLARGLPFLWWPTPSTTSPELEGALLERGCETEPTTGMYVDLTDPVDPAMPDGLTVELGADTEAFGAAMAAGFAIPEHFGPLLGAMYSIFAPDRMLKVVVRDGETPVASGALFSTGETAGLYCIAVRETHRRRGVASAISRVLMNIGCYQGCTHAVLHATDEAIGVYRGLGFEALCAMPQFSWHPPPSG